MCAAKKHTNNDITTLTIGAAADSLSWFIMIRLSFASRRSLARRRSLANLNDFVLAPTLEPLAEPMKSEIYVTGRHDRKSIQNLAPRAA